MKRISFPPAQRQKRLTGVDWHNPTPTDLCYFKMSTSDRSRVRYLLDTGNGWREAVNHVAHAPWTGD